MADKIQLDEGLEAHTCTKAWMAWSVTDRISKLVLCLFQRIQMPLLKTEALERRTLSKPFDLSGVETSFEDRSIGSRLSFMERVWSGAEEGVSSFDALELTREW